MSRSLSRPRGQFSRLSAALLMSLWGLAACGITPAAADPAAASARAEPAPLDVQQFLGRWYVIAAIPRPDGHDAYLSEVDYQSRSDGKINEFLQCAENTRTPPFDCGYRLGSVDNDGSNSHWTVLTFQFQYDIVKDSIFYVDPAYRYALAGGADRQSVWMLSRTPSLDAGKYRELKALLREQGFDTLRLRRTALNQPPLREVLSSLAD